MFAAAELIRNSRERAGLSMRALAARADVAYTTVQRIEQGSMDPTVGMLSRLLTAMGERLVMETDAAEIPELADLADAWHTDSSGMEWPDFTRLRAFLDYLSWHPELRGPSTLRAPKDSGSKFMNNLLAAIAEKTCDDAGISRPTWTKRIASLTSTWESPMTPRMKKTALASTPPQLKKRGIIMTTNSLWREDDFK
jgi:transcriptional regulator with XRE-family HTH domain